MVIVSLVIMEAVWSFPDWFFSERVGVYAELGYGVSVLNAGVSFMF